MPYGWDSNYPPQGNNHALPPHLYQQPHNGQQTQYTRPQPVAGHQQQHQHQNHNSNRNQDHNHHNHNHIQVQNQHGYSHSPTQYSTPYDQGSHTIYQSPSPPVQYQQQLYQSPPTPQNRFPPTVQYSPDPLQTWQNPPQAHRQAPQLHQGYQQQQPQQRRPSAQLPQNPRPDLARPLPVSVSERPQFLVSPYGATQHNAASVARTSQLPPQQRPQQQSQRQPQRAPSQPRPPSSGSSRSVSQAPHRPLQQPPYHAAAPVSSNHVQHRVAHVQIPVQRTPQQPDPHPMAPAPKRRRSNEGHAVPAESLLMAISQPPRPLPAGAPRLKATPVASSPLTDLASSQIPATPTTSSTIDNQAALLALSDEFIAAAYSMSVALSTTEVDEEQLDHYHSLLATGMGCLETVLKNYRISDARKEARIRLRFASLLMEETDNDLEAEECLSKGISACERSRLPDLKYAMHHLLARVWFKGGKTRAAMKAVEKLVVEAEKLNLIHWMYAFRLLRVSFGFQIQSSTGETAIMVKHLSAVYDTAFGRYDISVQIVASTLSAIVHLRSRSPDSVDSAQRDLAAARTHQLSPEMDSLPQVKALLDCLNLACSLVQVHPEQANAKMQVMQANLDTASREAAWKNEHNWSMPLGQNITTSPDIESDTYGIFRVLPSGVSALNFTWLNQTQIYATGFLLSGLSAMYHNTTNELKAEQFLSEGVKLSKQISPFVQQSVVSASAQARHQSSMLVTMRLYLVFAFCGRSAWDSGLNGIAAIRRDIQNWGISPDEATTTLLIYLEAVCKHGLGELSIALQLYRSPELALDPATGAKSSTGSVNPLRVLASLNSILVMRTSRATVEEAEQLLAQLEPHCTTHLNGNGNEYGSKALEAAFNILKATSSPQTSTEGMIIKTKQYLQSAVHGAKITLNNQLLCVVMNIMTNLFFTNIVGEQAEKSAKAGRSLAKKSKDKLWTAVADRMYADTLVRCGKSEDAQQVRAEGEQTMQQLPSAVRAAFQGGDANMDRTR